MTFPVLISRWQRWFSPAVRRAAAAALPLPLVDPRIPAVTLVAQAEARGVEDARRHVRDGWSFGGPAQARSEAFDPSYVASLRRQCEAAVQSVLERHAITEARTAHLREQRDEAAGFMSSARSMMDRLAVRAALLQEPTVDHGPVGDPAQAPREDVPDDDPVWEGDTVALGLVWRLLILLGLVVAQTPVHYMVFEYFLADRVAAGGIWSLCMSMAVFLVIGPHVAALLMRSRQATGAERGLTAAVVLMAVFWTAVVAVLGLMCAAVLDLNRDKLAALNLTQTTVVLMFVGGLVIAAAMAFMLGLSRRHPFQEAYARHRRRRDQAEALRRLVVDRINPEYTDLNGDGRAGPQALVEAVRAAYAAAEEAYFAAMTCTVGDPSFTEAVQHRRGLRWAGQP